MKKKIAGLFGGLALIAYTPLAHADVQIAYSINGATPVVCSTVAGSPSTPLIGEGTNCYSSGIVAAPGLVIENISTTGQQGQPTPGQSEQLSSTTEIDDTAGSPTYTIELWLSASDFTAPTAPPGILWTSNLTLTETNGTSTTSMISCADQSNGLASSAATYCTAAGSPTLTNNTQNLTGTISAPTDTVSKSITSLTSPYTLEEEITLTIKAGTSLNIVTSQILTQVPEPGAIMLLGSVLMLIGTMFRKKLGHPTA